MADTWQLFGDDPAERRTFATLRGTRALPAVPAGPKNRLRCVHRIDTPHGRYYLKTFTRTQWKNRLHFLLTAPRAHDDAERELLVTNALAAAGHFVPRPVAYGRAGATAYYLCAALPGAPVRELMQRGLDAQMLRGVATYCGQTLAAGFWLPDLSADHVFVDDEGDLYLLDLHNGQLGPAGTPPPRVLRRVLRRWRRSVRDLDVPGPVALRFAARLLRQAGVGDVRALLRQEPPWATAARYDAPGKSLAYAERNPRRTARELDLLRRVWPGRRGETVLDLPCGAGRLLPFLAEERGHVVVQADGSLAMLREARMRAPEAVPRILANAMAMPFADRAVDGVVVFRLLHHLPPDVARTVLAEACRVARRFVVVSFFHPVSAHHLRRTLGQWFGGTPTRFARTLGAVRRDCAQHGFRLLHTAADRPFARDLWVASFERS